MKTPHTADIETPESRCSDTRDRVTPSPGQEYSRIPKLPQAHIGVTFRVEFSIYKDQQMQEVMYQCHSYLRACKPVRKEWFFI